MQGVALPEGLEDADALLKGTVRDSVDAPMTAADDTDGGDGGGGTGLAVFVPEEYWRTRWMQKDTHGMRFTRP